MKFGIVRSILDDMLYGRLFEGENAGGDNTEEETEEVPELNDAQKAYFEKELAKVRAEASETAEQTATRIKAELEEQQKKEQKNKERKLAQDKAKADGDHAKVLQLAQEEKEEAQRERDAARAEAQVEKDNVKKLALVQKYKLPAGYEKRLLGANEADWEVDAKELAKTVVNTAPRVDQEGGRKATSTKEAQDKSGQHVASKALTGF